MNLPHNLQLEEQFIGQSVLEQRVVAPELETSDFYSPTYRYLWAAIKTLDEQAKEIEPFAIIKEASAYETQFTVPELVSLTKGLVYAQDMKPLAAELRELATRRYLMKALDNQITTLQTAVPIGEIVTSLEQICENGRDTLTVQESGFESLANVMEREVKPALDALLRGESKKIPTGFGALDKAIGGGLVESDVILVVSDTGNGKSAFVLQLADQLAKQNFPVAYVSGEMRNRENGLRLLTQNAQVTNLNSVLHITQNEKDILDEWADSMKDRPIYFDHTSGDLLTIKKNLRVLKKQYGIKVLIIDYIQLYRLTPNDRFQRTERLTEVSQEVKRMANELGIVIVEVAQFNREGAKKDKPSMHDLEGSGQLEKDCSLILIIDRSEEREDEIDIRIVKGRNSGKGLLLGRFEGRTLRFQV